MPLFQHRDYLNGTSSMSPIIPVDQLGRIGPLERFTFQIWTAIVSFPSKTTPLPRAAYAIGAIAPG